MDNNYNIKVKICLVGDASVGKTSLIRRYVMDVFDDKYINTLGTKVSKKKIILKLNERTINLTFSIWDILGQEDFQKIQTMAFKGSKGTMLVCDLTRKDTLTNLEYWHKRVSDVAGKIPFVVIANKSDLKEQYTFDELELDRFSKSIGAEYYYTSAKEGDNVIKTFYKIGSIIVKKIFDSERN